jgi:lipopolysaccharide export system protein LptA
MVATGEIEIEQPGRRATGGRLVYTANDGTASDGTTNRGTANGGLFVLTGDGRAQPKMVDAAHGTITGAALQFHSGDDSVVVSSVEPGATGSVVGQRVHTETHARKDATMGKGK